MRLDYQAGQKVKKKLEQNLNRHKFPVTHTHLPKAFKTILKKQWIFKEIKI